MITTFRDGLMCDSFDRFRNIIDEINSFKLDLKKRYQRVSPGLDVIISYRHLKQICLNFNKIFKSNKYSNQTAIDMFCDALIQLDLLIQELRDCECEAMANTFQHVYNRLFILLPKGTVLQPSLFDTSRYQNNNKKAPVAKSFLNWLRNYQLNNFTRRIAKQYKNFSAPKFNQPSLELIFY